MQPAPWAGGDANRDILFDWSEFTYNDAGLWLNSSQVDMFAVPHAVTVTGANGATKRTGDVVNNGRNAIIDGIRAQAGWANTVYTRSDGTVLRVLAPGKAAGAGLLSATYLDPYITSAWNAYTAQDADRRAVRRPAQHQVLRPYVGQRHELHQLAPASRWRRSTARRRPASGAATATCPRPTTWSSGRSRGRCAPR